MVGQVSILYEVEPNHPDFRCEKMIPTEGYVRMKIWNSYFHTRTMEIRLNVFCYCEVQLLLLEEWNIISHIWTHRTNFRTLFRVQGG